MDNVFTLQKQQQERSAHDALYYSKLSLMSAFMDFVIKPSDDNQDILVIRIHDYYTNYRRLFKLRYDAKKAKHQD